MKRYQFWSKTLNPITSLIKVIGDSLTGCLSAMLNRLVIADGLLLSDDQSQ